MSNVETKILTINIIVLGKLKAELKRINAPLTIQRIMKSLPIKGKAVKQGNRYILPTGIKPKPEKQRSSYQKGDISIDPSSGNISIYLDDIELDSPENYLGRITDEFNTEKLNLSTGVVIKEFKN